LALAGEAAVLVALRRRARPTADPRANRLRAIAAGAFVLALALVGAFGLRAKPATAAVRAAVWLNTAAMAKDHPLLGVGLGNHKVLYPAYARRVRVDPQASPVEQLDYVHDDYMQVAAELGVIGVALALWLGIAIVRSARRALAVGGPNDRVVLAFLLLTPGGLTD